MNEITTIITEQSKTPDRSGRTDPSPTPFIIIKRILPFALLVCLFLAVLGNAQTNVPMSHAMDGKGPQAQKIFEKMKTLAGSWRGGVTNTPPVAAMEGKQASIEMRVTSSGNALAHDLTMNGMPDNPLTIFYLEGDRLLLTHYCDAGNRPRMEGKISADGRVLEFDFVDLAGGNQTGHMHRAVFTIIDANHHIEEWTYMLPGDKPMRARFDLKRVK